MVLVRNHSVATKRLGTRSQQLAAPLGFSAEVPLEDQVVSDTSELDSPVRVLHRMILENRSGRLTIVDPRDPTVAWQVFIGNGQIHFATSSLGQQERLSYFLRKANVALPIEAGFPSDYQFLCAQWQQGRLTLTQVRTVLVSMTQDVLLHVLKLPQAKIQFNRQLGLDPLLMSVPLVKLLSPVLAELRQWQGYQSEILSPLQRPVVSDPARWSQAQCQPGMRSLQFVQPFLGHNFCLYQIAQEMKFEVSKAASLFQALVRWGLISMQPYRGSTQAGRAAVVCIDPSTEVQVSVKAALEPEGCQVIALTEPALVWSTLVQHNPQLLLLDVDYFDGYDFIKALLRSNQFCQTPMITLTEHQGLVNRLVGRRLGVLDCLVKPVDPQALRSLVHPLVGMAAVGAAAG